MDCKHLLRVDPGTSPPDCTFSDVFEEHIDVISDQNIVVSRGYAGRIAVRDFYCREAEIAAHHRNDEKEMREKLRVTDPRWADLFTRGNIADDAFLHKVDEGLENHRQLLRDWGEIGAILVDTITDYVSVK
jgi:hypothetical protein